MNSAMQSKRGEMLRDIVLMQKRELEQRLDERFIPREVHVPPGLDDLVCVVLGPRRAGKSFFAMHHQKTQGSFGYVNFDDERLVRLDDFDSLVAAVDSVYGQPRRLLLDEIQNIPRWELLVNRLQRQGYRLTVTGSNAHLLSSELATHLTGRHFPVVIFPFSFSEFLQAQGGELTAVEIAEAFRTYAENGGFPEPVVKGMPHGDYLRTLVRSTLYKDVVVRHRIRSPQGLEDLSGYLMANAAQRFSWRTLADVVGGRSVHTVRKYFDHMAEAFLFFALPRFSFKVREQAKAARKVYCVDNGMISSTAFRTSANLGWMYENLVAVALRKCELEGRLRAYYWQGAGQEEVDFIIQRDRTVTQLIQVCVDLDNPVVYARESRSLLKAGDALGCKDLLILTDSEDSERDASWYGLRGHIRILPIWRWALEQRVQE